MTTLRRLLDALSAFIADARDPYRPELYYMRGPGPKWRARHALNQIN